MRSPLRLILVLAVAMAVAVPTSAQTAAPCRDEFGNLVLTEQQSWITDAGGVKAGNLAAHDATDYPSWDDSAPTDSVQAGAGGGYFATSAGMTGAENGGPTVQWDPQYTATLKGAFDGCLDSMNVKLHMFASLDTAALGFHMMTARLLDGDTVIAQSDPVEVATTVNPNGSGDVTYVLPFAFRNLVAAYENAAVDPAVAHELTLQVQPIFSDVGHVVYLWDTTEVPSSIGFNAPTNKGFTPVN